MEKPGFDARRPDSDASADRVRVLVALEHHFFRSPDGEYYTDMLHGYPFWQRYLEVFDEVIVLARVKQVGRIDPQWPRADGPGVVFWPLPDYRGPWQYLRHRRRVRRIAKEALSQADCCVLRASGRIANIVAGYIRRDDPRLALEVVGDPWESLGPGSVKSVVRPFVRVLAYFQLRRWCRRARAAAYVTARMLQKRYPPGPEAFATDYSSVELPAEAIAAAPRDFQNKSAGEPWRLMILGSLHHMYKGVDILLEALAECVRRGANVHLEIVGDGKHRGELEELTRRLGLTDRVDFVGSLPSGRPVWDRLRQAELFVLPSRQEGLPRAMIEAMAAALPCIGSSVGGIGELIAPEDIVPPRDSHALAEKILEVLADPSRMSAMSTRNLAAAGRYRADVLKKRRTEYYRFVRDHCRRRRPTGSESKT